ncbi:unnamed protein product, partial [Bubo scandiacus]
MPITDWQRRCRGLPFSLLGGKSRGAAPPRVGAGRRPRGTPRRPGRARSPRGAGTTAAGAPERQINGQQPTGFEHGESCYLLADQVRAHTHRHTHMHTDRQTDTDTHTHTHRGFPTWKRFQTKTQDPAPPPAGRAAGPPRRGSPGPPCSGAAGTCAGGRGRAGTTRKRT